MFEAVTMPCLMTMASIVSDESLARDTHTHAADRLGSTLKMAKLLTIPNKKKISCEWYD